MQIFGSFPLSKQNKCFSEVTGKNSEMIKANKCGREAETMNNPLDC